MTEPEAPVAAVDDDVEVARRLFDEGLRLFEDERFEAALAQFRAAFDRLDGHERQYTVIYNIAQSLERLGRFDEARSRYARYLELSGPDAEDRNAVLARVGALSDVVGTLVVRSNAPRTEVWGSDYLLGQADDSIRISVGRHAVELRAPGHIPTRREVEITVDHTTELNAVLEQRVRGLDPIFFALATGLAGASFGVGLGFGIATQIEQDNAVALLASDDPDRFLIDAEYEANKDRLALTADVFFGLAGAFGIAAAVLAVLTEWTPPPDGDVAFTPLLGPGLAGLSVQVSR